MAERTDAHEPRWTERGASFLRRINLERVAEDPRVRLLVDGQSTGDISLTSPMNAQIPAPLLPPPRPTNPKTNDDPILHFSSRLAVLAPPAMQAVTKLFGAKTYTSTWADAQLAMSTLDAAIASRFAEKACVMDCGLLDAVQRTHQKPLVPDTFAGGRVTSLPFKRGAVPSMHSMFVAASTVASWLALDDAHVAVLLAPNQEQLSVYLACCAMYRAPFGTDLIAYGERILQWFNENVESAESLALRLSKTFIESDARNTSYIPGPPRPQARFLRDFTGLLLLRDQQLLASTSLQDRTSLSGAAVLPAQHPLYIHRISILKCPDGLSRYLPDNTMVLGLRSILVSSGPHAFKVGRTINTGDLLLQMYHVPVNSRGQLVFETRLHSSLLLRLCDGATDRRAAVVLQLKAGDFDCVSSLYTPHAEFGLLMEFGADAGTFPPEEEPTPTPSEDETRHRSSVLPPRRPPAPALPWTTIATYIVPQTVVYTCYGDGHLTQIDLAVRLAEHTLQFHVQCGDDQARVLSPHQLFGYVLPTAILDDLRTRRIPGIELPAIDGTSRDSFDVQYALWLQRQFDDDTTRLSNEIRIGTSPLEIEALVATHGTLGLVMLANQLQQADANSHGASDRMIAQLPKRVFSREREGIDIECLVCRYNFESGDDIRTLPCFHSYHTDCIDPWLRLKKVCPTCQVSIELGTAGDGDDDDDDDDEDDEAAT
ncbi:hypothetical protein SPRG_22303 [Saprolegnia parasitica CBS 223.65]|uniref:RING-type domain-containing protein n=1 Tax=Saprolegnia parasitica (strain CBS 223.65) TaxID=695850 RepID=A0A067BWA8_SAPPC|nr:hypothetical protein SPRG_22303 [Saprolegnia parasitica CBS 223.65]KDO22563.1 hypothetical protein SPRG_22303 [Saprolegnia parasitica CBS 223.65]|eukprot:XP_012206732.1 hypothetical protein SPRG_22303 [Saprolegnia parasitica CBS 223.65]